MIRRGRRVPVGSRRVRLMGGFTLIELVVAVTILGMIIGPLTMATTFYMSRGPQLTGTFADDTSIRAVISLFTTDAQSADTVTVPDPSPCGSAGPAIVTLTWTEDGTIYRSSWSTQASGSTTTLVRQRCTGTSLVSTLLVADVQSAPTVTCTPNCANPTMVTMTGVAANGAGFSVDADRRSS